MSIEQVVVRDPDILDDNVSCVSYVSSVLGVTIPRLDINEYINDDVLKKKYHDYTLGLSLFKEHHDSIDAKYCNSVDLYQNVCSLEYLT